MYVIYQFIPTRTPGKEAFSKTADRQTDRQTERQNDRPTDRHVDWQ